jgi:DNA topoisomerase-1
VNPNDAKPSLSARAGRLRYVSDQAPGIRRLRAGQAFRYSTPSGKPLRDASTLKRIKSLAIPPAWTDVWICRHPRGHLQATGRDAKGRKQFRYHPRWREVRDETKYHRIIAFGKALPKIRRAVCRQIRRPGLGREKILAAVVRLLELSALRVGNEEYVRNNQSYGLTTLRNRHAHINGSKIRLQFRGKGGKEQSADIDDPALARIVKKCQDLPGQELFQYVDDEGKRHEVTSSDVNAYLAEVTGQDFTAKDFRTWAGTVLAALALREFAPAHSKRKAKGNVVRAIGQVAQRLGNTPAICRKCYVHPGILEAYLDGSLASAIGGKVNGRLSRSLTRLGPEEAAIVTLLHKRSNESQSAKQPGQQRTS